MKNQSNWEVKVMKNILSVLPVRMFVLGLSLLFPMTLLAADLYTFQDEEGLAYVTNIPGPGRRKYSPSMARLRAKRKAVLPQKMKDVFIDNQDYAEAILSACERFSVDPLLVRAVIKAESNFDPEALSPKGAIGLMQLMPKTAREMGVSDPFNPVENIHGGVSYLSQLLNTLNGDVPLALAAYNAGPHRVMSYNGIPPFRETRNYIERVMGYYEHFKGKDAL
ncbi:MAG: Soluble lytic murein transglycosylase precursor [Syntrophus sp. PtaU1.Bin208]|nr:MAG: Soluble lytic murein transglycosylase precursor [Syntrophus sp. PtaU1.Bin208]